MSYSLSDEESLDKFRTLIDFFFFLLFFFLLLLSPLLLDIKEFLFEPTLSLFLSTSNESKSSSSASYSSSSYSFLSSSISCMNLIFSLTDSDFLSLSLSGNIIVLYFLSVSGIFCIDSSSSFLLNFSRAALILAPITYLFSILVLDTFPLTEFCPNL